MAVNMTHLKSVKIIDSANQNYVLLDKFLKQNNNPKETESSL